MGTRYETEKGHQDTEVEAAKFVVAGCIPADLDFGLYDGARAEVVAAVAGAAPPVEDLPDGHDVASVCNRYNHGRQHEVTEGEDALLDFQQAKKPCFNILCGGCFGDKCIERHFIVEYTRVLYAVRLLGVVF